jgi:hypothetical protein
MYLSVKNSDHQFVKQHGCHIIVLARDLPKEWHHFIYLKEVMHLFDDPLAATDSGDKLEQLLTDFSSPFDWENASPQYKSEIRCFWMALGIMCPEKVRQTYIKQREDGSFDEYAAALQLRIPQGYVPRLFDRRFEETIRTLKQK